MKRSGRQGFHSRLASLTIPNTNVFAFPLGSSTCRGVAREHGRSRAGYRVTLSLGYRVDGSGRFGMCTLNALHCMAATGWPTIQLVFPFTLRLAYYIDSLANLD